MAYFNLPFGVRIAGSDPIDGDRYIAADTTQRDLLVTQGRAEEGQQCYVIDIQSLFVLKGATNADWKIVGGGTIWGDIGGTLSNQTDLQTTLDNKLDNVTAGSDIAIDYTDPNNPIISATGSGDVSSSETNVTPGFLTEWDGVTGKLIKSGNKGIAEIDALIEDRIRWKGDWVNASYKKNDMVLSLPYLGIANINTFDVFPPQPEEPAVWNMSTSPTWTTQTVLGDVATGVDITFLQIADIKDFRAWVLGQTGEKHTISIYIFDSGVFRVLGSQVITNAGVEWVGLDLSDGSINLSVGDRIRIAVFTHIDIGDVETNTNYEWLIGSSTPATGVASSAGGDLYINVIDDVGTDRTSLLNSIKSNDVITLTESGSSDRWTQYITTAVGTINGSVYSVPAIVSGIGREVRDEREVNLDVIIKSTPVNTDYVEIVDYFTSRPNIKGFVTQDVNEVEKTSLPLNANTYGIDIFTLLYTSSVDWDYIPIGTGGGTSTGGGTIQIVDDLTTQDSASALSANQGYVLDQKKAEATDVVYNVIPGTGISVDSADKNNPIVSFTGTIISNTDTVTNVSTVAGVTTTNALETLESAINTNITDIATNVTNIGTNVTDIATNVTNISSNFTEIQTKAGLAQNNTFTGINTFKNLTIGEAAASTALVSFLNSSVIGSTYIGVEGDQLNLINNNIKYIQLDNSNITFPTLTDGVILAANDFSAITKGYVNTRFSKVFSNIKNVTANYTTLLADNDTIIKVSSPATKVILDSSDKTAGYRQQVLNNTGGYVTFETTDSIIGDNNALPDGMWAYYVVLEDDFTWGVSIATEITGGSGGDDPNAWKVFGVTNTTNPIINGDVQFTGLLRGDTDPVQNYHIANLGYNDLRYMAKAQVAIGKYDDGNGLGYYPTERDNTFYGNIGFGALDLSTWTTSSSTRGATGDFSFAMGYGGKASGYGSFGMGEESEASGTYSFVNGYKNIASGYASFASGAFNTVSSNYSMTTGHSTDSGNGGGNFFHGVALQGTGGDDMAFFGRNNILPTGNPYYLLVGNGTTSGDGTTKFTRLVSSDAFRVYKTGEIEAPSMTIAMIDLIGAKSLVTQEYLTNIGGNYFKLDQVNDVGSENNILRQRFFGGIDFFDDDGGPFLQGSLYGQFSAGFGNQLYLAANDSLYINSVNLLQLYASGSVELAKTTAEINTNPTGTRMVHADWVADYVTNNAPDIKSNWFASNDITFLNTVGDYFGTVGVPRIGPITFNINGAVTGGYSILYYQNPTLDLPTTWLVVGEFDPVNINKLYLERDKDNNVTVSIINALSNDYVEEAPNDGVIYGRQDKVWSDLTNTFPTLIGNNTFSTGITEFTNGVYISSASSTKVLSIIESSGDVRFNTESGANYLFLGGITTFNTSEFRVAGKAVFLGAVEIILDPLTPDGVGNLGYNDVRYELDLGVPSTDNYVLSSTIAGVRSWVPAQIGGGGATNLGYTPSTINGIVTSDTGTNATIPLAGINAGLLSPSEKIIIGNTSNTNSGDNAVNTLYSGLVSNVTTNLGYIPSAANGIVTSSDGTDATLTLVDVTNAGLASSADKVKIDGAVQTETDPLSWKKTGTTVVTNPVIDGDVTFNGTVGINYTGEDSSANRTFVIDVTGSTLDIQPAFMVRLRNTGLQRGFQIYNDGHSSSWASFAYNIGGSGKPGFELGAGELRDTNIYRDSENQWKTDDAFNIAGIISTSSDPTLDTHVGNRGYNDARYVNITGDTITGKLIVNNSDTGQLEHIRTDTFAVDRLNTDETTAIGIRNWCEEVGSTAPNTQGCYADLGFSRSTSQNGTDLIMPYLGMAVEGNRGVYLVAGKASEGYVSQINSKLQIGFDQSLPDLANLNTLAVNGNIEATGTYNGSDIRLKTDITRLDEKFVSFRYKKEPDVLRHGVIAQEIEDKNPELVQEGSGGMKQVNYIDLLILEIVELKNRIKKLEDANTK